MIFQDLCYVTLETETDKHIFQNPGNEVEYQDVRLKITDQNKIMVTADQSPLKYLILRWKRKIPGGVRILGDAWERSYGDLEWKGINGSRPLPWYFMMKYTCDGKKCSSQETCGTTGSKESHRGNCCLEGYGVKVRPDAMCLWFVDAEGITLVLDVRCGGSGVILNGKTITAAELVYWKAETEDSFHFAQEFCRQMCQDGIVPKHPVYGSNNWYYAYGHSSEEEILKDTKYLAALTEACENRPYMVIDDGWQQYRCDEYIGGPWTKGNAKFPDMVSLNAKMKALNVRTGIWIRLLQDDKSMYPDDWRLKHNGCLDPSHPDVLKHIAEDVKRLCDWGFELIKHDFSTYDLFGRWGFEMTPFVTKDGWNFYDKSMTSAQVVKTLYQTILDAAKGRAIILGCNTIGHLGAGLMHMNRTGDDTSGKSWHRTRMMGVNTLAFRLPQHRIFFDVDADCVGVMGNIPWSFNRQWADLIVKSGTSFFASVKPGVMTNEEEKEYELLLSEASEAKNRYIPMDWENNITPQTWQDGEKQVVYHWYAEMGEYPS